jgi:hypothetical protein
MGCKSVRRQRPRFQLNLLVNVENSMTYNFQVYDWEWERTFTCCILRESLSLSTFLFPIKVSSRHKSGLLLCLMRKDKKGQFARISFHQQDNCWNQIGQSLSDSDDGAQYSPTGFIGGQFYDER